jgi:hypothetical protein
MQFLLDRRVKFYEACKKIQGLQHKKSHVNHINGCGVIN